MEDSICKADPFPPTPPTDSSSPKLQPEKDTTSRDDYKDSLEFSKENLPRKQSLNCGDKPGLSTMDSTVKMDKLIVKSKEIDPPHKEQSKSLSLTEVETPGKSNAPSGTSVGPVPDTEEYKGPDPQGPSELQEQSQSPTRIGPVTSTPFSKTFDSTSAGGSSPLPDASVVILDPADATWTPSEISSGETPVKIIQAATNKVISIQNNAEDQEPGALTVSPISASKTAKNVEKGTAIPVTSVQKEGLGSEVEQALQECCSNQPVSLHNTDIELLRKQNHTGVVVQKETSPREHDLENSNDLYRMATSEEESENEDSKTDLVSNTKAIRLAKQLEIRMVDVFPGSKNKRSEMLSIDLRKANNTTINKFSLRKRPAKDAPVESEDEALQPEQNESKNKIQDLRDSRSKKRRGRPKKGISKEAGEGSTLLFDKNMSLLEQQFSLLQQSMEEENQQPNLKQQEVKVKAAKQTTENGQTVKTFSHPVPALQENVTKSQPKNGVKSPLEKREALFKQSMMLAVRLKNLQQRLKEAESKLQKESNGKAYVNEKAQKDLTSEHLEALMLEYSMLKKRKVLYTKMNPVSKNDSSSKKDIWRKQMLQKAKRKIDFNRQQKPLVQRKSTLFKKTQAASHTISGSGDKESNCSTDESPAKDLEKKQSAGSESDDTVLYQLVNSQEVQAEKPSAESDETLQSVSHSKEEAAKVTNVDQVGICVYCDKYFPHSLIKAHKKKVHHYKCQKCKITFNSAAERRHHRTDVHGHLSHVCTLCNLFFDHEKLLTSHYTTKRHHEKLVQHTSGRKTAKTAKKVYPVKTSKKWTKKKQAITAVSPNSPVKDAIPSTPSREREKPKNVSAGPGPPENVPQVFSPPPPPPPMQYYMPRPPQLPMEPGYASRADYTPQPAAVCYPFRPLGHPNHGLMGPYSQGYSPRYPPLNSMTAASGSLSPASSNVSHDSECVGSKAHYSQSQWPGHPPGPGIFIQGGFITLPISHLNNMGLGGLLANPGPPHISGGSGGYPPPTPQYYPPPPPHYPPAQPPVMNTPKVVSPGHPGPMYQQPATIQSAQRPAQHPTSRMKEPAPQDTSFLGLLGNDGMAMDPEANSLDLVEWLNAPDNSVN